MILASYQGDPCGPGLPDDIMFDYNINAYVSRRQTHTINHLMEALKGKQEEKQIKLKNLIAYYYTK